MLFSMFLYMSQIDFLLLRVIGDVLVTIYSTHMFLKAKKVDPEAYAKESSSSSSSPVERAVITWNQTPLLTEYPRIPQMKADVIQPGIPLVVELQQQQQQTQQQNTL